MLLLLIVPSRFLFLVRKSAANLIDLTSPWALWFRSRKCLQIYLTMCSIDVTCTGRGIVRPHVPWLGSVFTGNFDLPLGVTAAKK